jgi:hypothetical protein
MPLSGPQAPIATSVRGNRLPLPDTANLGPGLSGAFNGLAFGIPPSSSDPPPWIDVDTFIGFDDLPVIRSSDAPRANDHGSFPGSDWAEARFMQLGLHVMAGDHLQYRQAMDSIRAAFTTSLVELPLYIWDSTRVVFCKVRKRHIPTDPSWDQVEGTALMELSATDPRIYDAQPLQTYAQVATPVGGLLFPVTFPMTFGVATAGSGTFQAINSGNFETRPTARIYGPIDNPRIEHSDLGLKIDLAISLATGDYLDIDFGARSITLNGTASRRYVLTGDSTWFALVPGLNNLRFAANSVSTTGLLSFSWRSAWL